MTKRRENDPIMSLHRIALDRDGPLVRVRQENTNKIFLSFSFSTSFFLVSQYRCIPLFFRVWCISSSTMMIAEKRATSNARRDRVFSVCSVVINNNSNKKSERNREGEIESDFCMPNVFI